MFASLGNQVTGLHREAIGGLSLDPTLREGECRLISSAELDMITEQG